MQLASVELIKNIYLATFRNRSFISQLHESVIIQMFTVCATYIGQNNSTPADLYNLISHTVIYFVPLASPSYMFQDKNRLWTSCFLLYCSTNLEPYTYYYQSLTWRLQTSPQNSLLCLAITLSPPSNCPAHMILFFFKFWCITKFFLQQMTLLESAIIASVNK